MNPNREEALFAAALAKPTNERAAFLDGACHDDAALRQRLDALLAAHEQPETLLAPQVEAVRLREDASARQARPTIKLDLADEPMDEAVGQTIGHYKLLQKIGEGGFGMVYMAEQREPVKRRVALKIIKLGMDTKQVVARFEAERQALAMMDHPNIAKVLDAGATETGRPYFVMELVKGVPVTQYCDDRHLTLRDRLELFVSICRAVQHAHQKGIIHRDLKPSNVLAAEYDHRVLPRIIDFGVAKALHQSLTEGTMFTRYGEIIGTVDYMSPEQARFNELDIDTRSDVYSLGVLLYELMAGSTPFDKQRLHSSALDEVLRIIREEEPPKPSTRLHSSAELPALAARRKADAGKLPGLIRGDLDWIVMKAMAKERNERYQTAEALAADIERHLQYQPIEARRPSAIGRARRFIRRNKVPVSLAALVLASGGIAAMLGVVAYIGRLEQREQALVIQNTQAREERETWARQTAIPAVKQLIQDGRFVHAFRLAREVRAVLPDDPGFKDLWDSFTVTVTFDLEPAGTRVYLRDWDGADDEWLEVGATPLVDVTLPDGELRFRYVKEGYVTREFHREFPEFLEWDGSVSMREDWGIPEEKVLIDGVQAAGWNGLPADLGDFLIDRYEVTNHEFQDFVGAGGYEMPKFWEHLEFRRDDEILSWQQAMLQFRDQTGQAGPAGWQDGSFPEGQEDYPVRGVSWFEAAAYARFAESELPTIHHWRWAADGAAGRIVALSNFSRQSPKPVGTHPGIGRFDVYDLAGNVKEWCWNADPEGRRCLRGGAWNEAGYQFLFVDVASPWDRGETHGFRCLKYLSDGAPPRVTLEPWHRKPPHLTGRERLPLESLLPWYQYDEDRPLNPQPDQRMDFTDDGMRHETIRIDAAYGDEQFDIHLFLPRDRQDEHETIVFVPGAGAWLSQRFGPAGMMEWELIPRLVQTGRIVCFPVCKGMFERGDGTFPLPGRTVQSRDIVVAGVKDLARTLDYLVTRDDVDPDRIGYLGYSSGAMTAAMPVLTVHHAVHAAILIAAGYVPVEPTPAQQVFFTYHFAPHVRQPVLLITGAYDTFLPLLTGQAPFFDDLGSTNKKHVLLESGHNPPNEDIMKAADEWLREIFGPP